jgi:hypothetical protein
MKKNIFVISENERERILNMHKDAIKRNYLTEQETPPVTAKPARPANVQQFQEFVRNEKGDTTVGKADNKFGPLTAAAYAKYGDEYDKKYGANSQRALISRSAADNTGWLDWPCVTDVGEKYTTDGGQIIYKLSYGNSIVYSAADKKPALFSGMIPGGVPKLERIIDCNDQVLKNVIPERTALDKKKWLDWSCITSVGKERITKNGWVVYDFPAENKYIYFHDFKQTPVLADMLGREDIRPIACTDPIITAATASAVAASAATASAEILKITPGLSKLLPDMQTRVTAWTKTPSGQYILALTPQQRENGLDQLDRRGGDPETKAIKKEIRIALGMAADTRFGQIAQGVKGAVQGYQQGTSGV